MKKFGLIVLLVLTLLCGCVGSAGAEGSLQVVAVDVFSREYVVIGGSGEHVVVMATVTDADGNVLLNSTNPKEGYLTFEDDKKYTFSITIQDVVSGESVSDTLSEYYEEPYRYWHCECDRKGHEDIWYEPEDGGEYQKTEYRDHTLLEMTQTTCKKQVTIAYYCVCDYCDAYLYTKVEVYGGPHRFNSEGYCWNCGYDSSCQHTNTEIVEGMLVISPDVAYTNVDHYVVRRDEKHCNDCGVFIEYVDTGYWEGHTLGEGGNCACGYTYVCEHDNVQRLEVGEVHYEQLDKQLHTRIAVVQEICNACGAELSEAATIKEAEPHTFDKKGELAQRKLSSKDEQQHTVNESYLTICSKCGETGDIGFSSVYEEPHTLVDGLCECGYQIGCKHAAVKGREAGEPTYGPLNLLRHTKITNMQDICEDCGAQVGEDWQNSITEPHTFVAGVCSLCGAEEVTDSEYEPLSVLLLPWARVVSQGDTVAVTPQITGGSGQYEVTARAESRDGQVVHGHTAVRGNSANIWVFYVTVKDMITGEIVRAESPHIVVLGNCRHAETKPVEPRVETVYLSTYEAERHGVYRKTTPIDQCDNCHQLVEREPALELTAVEKHSFNKGVCEDCGQLSKEAAAERYSIYIDSEEYYPAFGTVFLGGHLFGLQLEVYDAQEDKVIDAAKHPELAFVMSNGKGKLELSEDYKLRLIEHFTAVGQIELQYCGEMLSCLNVRDDHIMENGDDSGNAVTLGELKSHNWDDHGVWISDLVEIFDLSVGRFDVDASNLMDAAMPSREKDVDFYRLKFDAFNMGPSAYAVVSYYADGEEYERAYIKSHWEGFSMRQVLADAWEGFTDFPDGKIGNVEIGKTRTEIEIYVPAGGYVAFEDGMNDDVLLLNKVNYAVRALALSESYMCMFNVLDVKDKKALAEALEEMDWQDVVLKVTSLYTNTMKLQTGIADISVEALMKDSTFLKCLMEVIVSKAGGELLGKGEDVALMAIDPATYMVTHGTDAIGQTIQHGHLKKLIDAAERGESEMSLLYVFMPQR